MSDQEIICNVAEELEIEIKKDSIFWLNIRLLHQRFPKTGLFGYINVGTTVEQKDLIRNVIKKYGEEIVEVSLRLILNK